MVIKRQQERMRVKCSTRFSLFAKRFGEGQWSFLGPGSEKKWYSINEDSPQGEWDRIAEKMMLTFAESQHPVFRSTSPLSIGGQESQRNLLRNTTHHMKNQNPTKNVNLDLTNVDHVSSGVRSSPFGSMLDVIEENEAVTKIMIKVEVPQ